MKKVFIIISIIFLVFIIYLINEDNKIYYLALGDSLVKGETPYGSYGSSYSDYINKYLKNNNKLEEYINQYSTSDDRITDLINKINSNTTVYISNKKHTIKNDLVKADLITINIGINDILTKFNVSNLINYNDFYNYIDDLSLDLDKLLKLIRNHSKEKIVLLGYYNPYNDLNNQNIDKIFKYLNLTYKTIAKEYDILYIDLYKDFKSESLLPNPNNIHPSQKGYKLIAEKIINVIN